jgi:hypothetical protein
MHPGERPGQGAFSGRRGLVLDGFRPYARVRARGSAGQLSIKELTPARPLRYGHPQAREGERVDPGPLGRGRRAPPPRRRWRPRKAANLLSSAGSRAPSSGLPASSICVLKV